MDASTHQEKWILECARKRSVVDRAAFLDGACLGDTAFRMRIEALLQTEEHNSGVERPTVIQPRQPPTEAPVEEGPGTQISHYHLLEKIGEGGFGVVYAAEQREPVKRRVALKIIKLGMDTRQVVARLEAERQALALMEHPSIAKVLDGGATNNGRPFFVMELVRGVPITRYCDEQKLSTRERLGLFVQVCQAIQHAHQKGVIHRDIKPSNILVTLQSGTPVPKVIDFGVAKATQQQLSNKTVYTQMQQFIGTPPYMSPEQADMSALDIDTRSDIYSLGVLLYELLVGKTPFDGKELVQSGLDLMRRTIREKEPVRPSTRLSSMPRHELATTAELRRIEPPKLIGAIHGDLDWIVMKCLEKDRSRRYETANGLAHDIQRHLSHEPVSARPPSTFYKLEKFIRRNKVVVMAAATVLVVLVAGILFSTWQAVRATQAEGYAQLARQSAVQNATRANAESVRALAAEQQAHEDLAAVRRQLYATRMSLLQLATGQRETARAVRILDETASYPERGFEWYYWQRQLRQPDSEPAAPLILKGHQGRVWSASFSTDSKWILTGGEDQTAKVRDAVTGREWFALRMHTGAVRSVMFSPDGQRAVTGSEDQTAIVWDMTAVEPLFVLRGHTDAVTSISVTGDSRRIVTGSLDGTAKVWDLLDGKELFTLIGHSQGISSVSFSFDAKHILTGSFDRTARLWNAENGQQLQVFGPHGDAVTAAVLSSDNKRIATGGRDGRVIIWDATTATQLLTLAGHSSEITSVTFSPTLRRLLTGSLDGSARLWDATSGNELLCIKAHAGGVRSVAFSPDDSRILTAGDDGTAKVFEADTPPQHQ